MQKIWIDRKQQTFAIPLQQGVSFYSLNGHASKKKWSYALDKKDSCNTILQESFIFFYISGLCQSTTNQESSSQSYDCIKFREYSKDQCITEHVVTLTDSSDTIGTNLSLADRWEQSNQSQSNTCTQYAFCEYATWVKVDATTKINRIFFMILSLTVCNPFVFI